LDIIQQINKILKIKNSVYTNDVIIDRKLIEIKFIKWLEKDDFKKVNEIEKVFNFRNKITKSEMTFKKIIGLLNRIYDGWNQTKFICNESDSKKSPINYKLQNIFHITINSYNEKIIKKTEANPTEKHILKELLNVKDVKKFNIHTLFKFPNKTTKDDNKDEIDFID
jgi:hypothetical protein